jgi:hypothetical protein
MKALIFILPLIVLIAGCAKAPVDSGKYDNLSKCLTEKGVVMYGTEWCTHCQNQKKSFGDSFQYITFVDCDKNKDECVAAGVEGYPTWKVNGTNYPGEQNFYTLAKNAGCVDKLI